MLSVPEGGVKRREVRTRANGQKYCETRNRTGSRRAMASEVGPHLPYTHRQPQPLTIKTFLAGTLLLILVTGPTVWLSPAVLLAYFLFVHVAEHRDSLSWAGDGSAWLSSSWERHWAVLWLAFPRSSSSAA